MRLRNLPLIFAGTWLITASMQAQVLKKEYIQWWPSDNTRFANILTNWQTSHKVTDDDNFFISRVKPKLRFRNANTQVNKNLQTENDKRLLAWLPVNNPETNALPDGIFDSEVFTMWSYVDHWGDWSSPYGRVPAALMDVAHKNGVAVSGVWGLPNASLNSEQSQALNAVATSDPTNFANYLYYYGNDGLGYNSEFADASGVVARLATLHANLVKQLRPKNPIFENIWYDGTTDDGQIWFDMGLDDHNYNNFGDSDNEASSFFLNYNWGSEFLMQRSIANAEAMGRNPLDLFAGFNMQGGTPRSWPLLARYRMSIGLWGAHSRNMFWESRAEKGSNPDVQQRTYMLRTEKWFTGSTRNPANVPALSNTMSYSADNTNFGGMSSMMSARSSLSWDLAAEPFITYFNLGNGKFFNWEGTRKHDKEWYNLGVQDYLPTWRWWFASSLLGKDVPANALDAEFVWTDAYVGGSCVRIFGSSAASEYLHLFKTDYLLKKGDVITVKYKHLAGNANMNLVLTAKGDEATPITDGNMSLMTTSQVADDGVWVTRTITVGDNLNGKNIALIALQFDQAQNLNLELGELSIVRGSFAKPSKPVLKSFKLLAFNKSGIDGKIIWDMTNDKAEGTPVYNTDVNTSLFKLWAQTEGGEPILMGITTSWAGMMYAIPVDVTQTNSRVRLGVSALSLDMKSESEVEWSDYADTPTYIYSNAIQIDKTIIKPEESFTMSYQDPRHDVATWTLKNANGESVFTGSGSSVIVPGLPAEGAYDLVLDGVEYAADGTFTNTTTTYPSFVTITNESLGALPQVYTLTANGKEADLNANISDVIDMQYTGRSSDGSTSRGLNLAEKGFVFKATEAGITNNRNAWTLSFWMKLNSIAASGVQFLDMRDQTYQWPMNNWGCFWSTLSGNGKTLSYAIRGNNGQGAPEKTQEWEVNFKPNVWTYVTIVSEAQDNGVRNRIYVDGKLAKPIRYKNIDGSTGTGLSEEFGYTQAWWVNAYMMLGFGRHQLGALDAIIDDVKFFRRALTADEVVALKQSNDQNYGTPSSVWSFEEAPNAENWFTSTGTLAVKGASAKKTEGTGEGVGTYTPVEPWFMPGSPLASGSAFKVVTKPTWSAPKGALTDVQGDAKAGSAKVSYAADGAYKVTLTLENEYGKDSKVFQVITIGTANGVSAVEGNTMKTYTIDRDVFVEFAESGNYTIQLFTANGMSVANESKSVSGNNKVRVHVANAGVYILKVTKDGKTLRTAKLICK